MDPVGSIRDFGIKALQLSTDFLISTGAKLYYTQLYILSKGLTYYDVYWDWTCRGTDGQSITR